MIGLRSTWTRSIRWQLFGRSSNTPENLSSRWASVSEVKWLRDLEWYGFVNTQNGSYGFAFFVCLLSSCGKYSGMRFFLITLLRPKSWFCSMKSVLDVIAFFLCICFFVLFTSDATQNPESTKQWRMWVPELAFSQPHLGQAKWEDESLFWWPFPRSFPGDTLSDGENCIYFCGNSLGLKPKKADDYMKDQMDKWGQM